MTSARIAGVVAGKKAWKGQEKSTGFEPPRFGKLGSGRTGVMQPREAELVTREEYQKTAQGQ